MLDQKSCGARLRSFNGDSQSRLSVGVARVDIGPGIDQELECRLLIARPDVDNGNVACFCRIHEWGAALEVFSGSVSLVGEVGIGAMLQKRLYHVASAALCGKHEN